MSSSSVFFNANTDETSRAAIVDGNSASREYNGQSADGLSQFWAWGAGAAGATLTLQALPDGAAEGTATNWVQIAQLTGGTKHLAIPVPNGRCRVVASGVVGETFCQLRAL